MVVEENGLRQLACKFYSKTSFERKDRAAELNTIDFSKSFLTFRIDRKKKPPQTASHKPRHTLNNARIQIECRCRIEDRETGQQHNFVLGASCKTERVGVERDIWTEPNADFAPIFSDDGFMYLKTFAHRGIRVDLYPPGSGVQDVRQSGKNDDAFDSVRIDVVECEGESLESAKEIVEATLAGVPLVAVTEIENDRYVATIEYPVKTMNANERDDVYQTDTGPMLLPDLTAAPEELLTTLELAFAAFNCPEWTEFLTRVPTKINDEIAVEHYSRPVRVNARNRIVRVSG